MAKVKVVLSLDPATAEALAAFRDRRRERFPHRSAAAEHLLQRALLGAIDEGVEELLAPTLARRVEAAAARVVREEVAALLRAQTDRLAGLLVRSGKDARASTSLGTAILEELTGDRQRARRLADEARLAAGAAYTAPHLRAAGED